MKINLNEKLNIGDKLQNLWSEFMSQDDFAPLFPEEVRTNAVTFLSLNPSLPPQFRKDAKKGFSPETPYPMIECNLAKANYPFFNKFYEIGNEFKPWTILDLLYERESNQKVLEEKYSSKNIDDNSRKFLIGQLKITFEILEEIKPKVVVITNTATEKLIHSNLIYLNLIQSLPSADNNFIYRLNNIPFIIVESRFLGSRFMEHNKDRRALLTKEIQRVLELIQY